MPIYEYVCPACACNFEELRPMSRAEEPVSCPKCQKTAKRKISSFACFSTNESGMSAPVGGSSCSGCGSSNCGSCGM
ncbi:MAG: zinc ribbon domain-containing protein [Chloroflexota bacterium]